MVDHVSPPFVVLRIVPLAPTINPVVVVGKWMDLREAVVPDGMRVQLEPLSLDLTIAPNSPTAKIVEVVGTTADALIEYPSGPGLSQVQLS